MKKKGIAVVVGASQGIGACVAQGLAADGYQLVLLARHHEKLLELAASISLATHEKPIVHALDITQQEQLAEVFSTLCGLQKPIDVLVNAAGHYTHGTLDETVAELRYTLETNVIAQFAILKYIVPIMQQQQSGYIFNIASRAGKIGMPDRGVYAASKFALVGLSESLYRELAAHHVKLTTICPSWVNTAMANEAKTTLLPEQMIQPADILHTIRYLLALSASVCVRELSMECGLNVF